jgi:AcrR family transcriptional regulator
MPSRRLPAAERRETILAAGASLFGARGYDGTSLDDVAAAAGVTKPILYRHFASKQDLYLALLRRHAEDMPEFVDPPPLRPDGSVDLAAILDTWFAYARDNGHGWRMLFRDPGGGPAIEAYRAAVYVRARAVLEDFIRVSGAAVAEDLVPATAEMIRAGLAGLVLWWQENPDTPREVLVATATALLAPTLGDAAEH